MKVNMKDTDYYKSGKHKENVLAAHKKALAGAQLKYQERINNYNKNPTLCAECGSSIKYDKRHNKFCCRSCAGLYNGRAKGGQSEATKNSIAASLKKYHSETSKQVKCIGRSCKIFEITCKVCSKTRLVNSSKKNRVTCGDRDCVTHASVGMRTYQNGSRKPVWYFNPYENKEVLLDSSWEVIIADLLIEQNIKWIRPEPVKWYDDNNISRLYYPDFYLTDYDLYLDPKNPYCMEKDKEKLNKVCKLITLEYGSLDHIKQIIGTVA